MLRQRPMPPAAPSRVAREKKEVQLLQASLDIDPSDEGEAAIAQLDCLRQASQEGRGPSRFSAPALLQALTCNWPLNHTDFAGCCAGLINQIGIPAGVGGVIKS
jgi:hypothetical protein